MNFWNHFSTEGPLTNNNVEEKDECKYWKTFTIDKIEEIKIYFFALRVFHYQKKIIKNTVFIYEYRQILIDINSPLKHSKTIQTILSDRHYVVDVIALDKMITVIKTAI